jgi:enediyne biosynthesis protein E4
VPRSRTKIPKKAAQSSPVCVRELSPSNKISRRQFGCQAALGAAALIGAPGLLTRRSAGAQTSNSSPAGPSLIRFENIAEKSGLHYITENCPTSFKNQPETMAGGVALLDYDGDGYLDVYLTSGAAIPSLQKDSPKYWNRLFRNNHDGTFTDVTEKAGVAGAGYTIGTAVGDYDNDGRPDLFVANVTANQLFHNNGDGTFTDVTQKAGLAGETMYGMKMWSVGGGWFDYNNDGLLDLFVVNYCKWEVDKDPVCGTAGVRGYCHPKYYSPLRNTLYRNNGDGTFTDVSEETGIAGHLGKGMSVSFADYDHDGFMDAFVANDTMANFLLRNVGGKKFEEDGVWAGVAYGPYGLALSGMGSDFRDVNNDGWADIWHTAVEHETFPLYINQRNGNFANKGSGLAIPTVNMSGWSNGIFDFDNDGWKDLFVARGNVMDTIGLVVPGRHYGEPNSVFRNLRNGNFEDVSDLAGADFQKLQPHRGGAFGSLFNDGRIDAVVTILGGPTELWRNVSNTNHHWILFDLVGTRSNRMGIGAQIRIVTQDGRSQSNQATTAVGYASSSDSRVHFGVGANKQIAEAEIRWPSGIRQVLRSVPVDRVMTVEEPRK